MQNTEGFVQWHMPDGILATLFQSCDPDVSIKIQGNIAYIDAFF